MTGLERITEQILLEAKKTSEEQLTQTKREAEQLRLNAISENEIIYKKAKEQIDANTAQILSRGRSAAELMEKKMLLSAKQQILNSIFEEAVDFILQLPVNEYFDFLLHMVERYAILEKGVLFLSSNDLERVPDPFYKELEKRSLTISERPVRIRGGFIISYGDIEENCSFEALMAANRESLSDQIVSLIF